MRRKTLKGKPKYRRPFDIWFILDNLNINTNP